MNPVGQANLLGLRAVTVPLPEGPPIDVWALAGEEGMLFDAPWLTLAGRGQAALLPLPGGLDDPSSIDAALRLLADLPCENRLERPGTGVVALGALPFSRSLSGHLIVPEMTYGRDAEGREWATLVRLGDQTPNPDPRGLRQELVELAGRNTQRATPGGNHGGSAFPTLHPEPTPEGYVAAVESAIAAIKTSALHKVVLSRLIDVRFRAPIGPVPVLRRLRDQEPACTVFSYPVEGGRFLGASPELLVSRRDQRVRCHPLAGTVGLSGEPGRDAQAMARLEASAKDQGEHRLVVEEIAGALAPWCRELDVPLAPSLVPFHSVAHLSTRIEGMLHPDLDEPATVLDLLALLHPTAAVGGVPRDAALALISSLEPVGRGHWAGPVGWVDQSGDGDWMIGIRSMTVAGPLARLRAGCGIVERSKPVDELAESGLKLAPLLDALAPGLVATLGPDLTP